MKYYKLKKGLSEIFLITTKEDFEEKTGNKRAFMYFGEDKNKRGLAICPACDNPIRILGLYKKLENRSPYGQHHNKSTDFATFDKNSYIHCPYSNPDTKNKDISNKERLPSEYEKQIYYITRDYFDKIIYYLNKKINLRISDNFATKRLNDFIKYYGYMQYDASIYNIPWKILDSSSPFNLINMSVKKDSELWKKLKKLDSIILIENPIIKEYDIIKNKNSKYVNLQGHFIKHTRIIVDDEIEESITLAITEDEEPPLNWIYKETYKVKLEEFNNFCNKTQNKFRNEKQLKIAREIMKDI